ncbi:hypothetical protein SS50377_27359 [Spironucleus salmonicida]|uniref:Uncharacterized protein n=1 Tax=Spironucleus salmonicida TaxID=348837 RepID=V6LRC9_9EUKA|nr:hypothetical protein SS50377_27359 [Spironucleus salmonicida]|eukprot:EST43339.1 Hypothetical protein SS50377_17017 [Spironucleus salmonicida]
MQQITDGLYSSASIAEIHQKAEKILAENSNYYQQISREIQNTKSVLQSSAAPLQTLRNQLQQATSHAEFQQKTYQNLSRKLAVFNENFAAKRAVLVQEIIRSRASKSRDTFMNFPSFTDVCGAAKVALQTFQQAATDATLHAQLALNQTVILTYINANWESVEILRRLGVRSHRKFAVLAQIANGSDLHAPPSIFRAQLRANFVKNWLVKTLRAGAFGSLLEVQNCVLEMLREEIADLDADSDVYDVCVGLDAEIDEILAEKVLEKLQIELVENDDFQDVFDALASLIAQSTQQSIDCEVENQLRIALAQLDGAQSFQLRALQPYCDIGTSKAEMESLYQLKMHLSGFVKNALFGFDEQFVKKAQIGDLVQNSLLERLKNSAEQHISDSLVASVYSIFLAQQILQITLTNQLFSSFREGVNWKLGNAKILESMCGHIIIMDGKFTSKGTRKTAEIIGNQFKNEQFLYEKSEDLAGVQALISELSPLATVQCDVSSGSTQQQQIFRAYGMLVQSAFAEVTEVSVEIVAWIIALVGVFREIHFNQSLPELNQCIFDLSQKFEQRVQLEDVVKYLRQIE